MIYNDLLNLIAICLSNKFSGIRGNDNTQTWIPHPLYVLTIKKSRACFYPSSLKQVQLASILVGNKFGSWQFHLYQILNITGLELALVRSCSVHFSTELGSLIGNFDCAYYTVLKFTISLLLWFYMKSILADFKRSKTTVLTILKALMFYFFRHGNVVWNCRM